MSNVITDRISFWLKDFPPFSFLKNDQRDEIAEKFTVQYFEEGSFVFRENDPPNNKCYVLRQGDIQLTRNGPDGPYLVDQCEPGDIFGIRSILTGNPYSMNAECLNESLVYALPIQQFESLLKTNSKFSLFFAKGYAAGQAVVRETDREISDFQIIPSDSQLLKYTTTVITGKKEESIYTISIKMKNKGVGSVVIVDNSYSPIGIVTDTDLRNKALAENKSSDQPIASIMSGPVITVKPDISLLSASMAMIDKGVHHLIVTENGTPETKVCGVISDHDILLSQQNHPTAFLKGIKYSDNVNEWKRIRDQTDLLVESYLDQGASISLMTRLITRINDLIIEKAIEQALIKFPAARNFSFCWLNLGSEGRKEQLLRTDQDNAILFADSDDNANVQSILLEVGRFVNQTLMDVGFEKCPADIMAQNPQYCQPMSAWKEFFTQWILTPDPKAVMNSTIFFDLRPVHGDLHLAEELSEHLLQEIENNKIFLNFLAQNSLQNPPPLTFFKGFLVERSGEHRSEFDIKKRAMMPLSDIARLLVLFHKQGQTQNTSERFMKLAELEPKYESLFKEAAEAYLLFIKMRCIQGLHSGDSGRYIDLGNLSKMDKVILKSAFHPIRELQEIVKVRFQQAYFS